MHQNAEAQRSALGGGNLNCSLDCRQNAVWQLEKGERSEMAPGGPKPLPCVPGHVNRTGSGLQTAQWLAARALFSGLRDGGRGCPPSCCGRRRAPSERRTAGALKAGQILRAAFRIPSHIQDGRRCDKGFPERLKTPKNRCKSIAKPSQNHARIVNFRIVVPRQKCYNYASFFIGAEGRGRSSGRKHRTVLTRARP